MTIRNNLVNSYGVKKLIAGCELWFTNEAKNCKSSKYGSKVSQPQPSTCICLSDLLLLNGVSNLYHKQ